jgi:outer membrane protein assembly factor BamB
MRTTATGLLLGSLISGGLFAADWPQWGGRGDHNMISSERPLPASFVPGKKDPQTGRIDLATTKNVKWVVKIGSNTLSTPAVADGRIFLGTMDEKQGLLKCLDAETGRPLWVYTAPHRVVPRRIDPKWPFNFGTFAPQLGICSSPAVDQGRVYFVNHRCEVVCLDARGDAKPTVGLEVSTAKVLWVFDMWDTLGVRPSDACDGSALVDGDLLYICTSNGVDREASAATFDDRKAPAPDAPNLIVLDKRTGRLVATDAASHIGPNLLHGQWSSPTLGVVNGRKLIFFGGGDGICYAFEALTGVPEKAVKLRTVWWFDCNPPEYKRFGDLSWAAHYSLGDKRLKKSLNKENDGTFVGMSEIIGTPVFYKNRVYVAIGRDPEHGRGRGALWCIDATKTGNVTAGGRLWSYQGLDRTLSTVAIADGLLYVADVAGRVHGLDAESGRCYWVHETKATTWGSTLVADGKVYLPTQKSLFVLAAGKEARLLDKISLGSAAWATPVAANGTLYVTSTRYLWAVQGEKP